MHNTNLSLISVAYALKFKVSTGENVPPVITYTVHQMQFQSNNSAGLEKSYFPIFRWETQRELSTAQQVILLKRECRECYACRRDFIARGGEDPQYELSVCR